MEQIISSKKFGLIRLIMRNIIAVDSLRNISITAQAGWIVITFYILAGIFFLTPCALRTAEMSTGSSQENGGIYIWVKKA
ncbi:amino acid transporter, partial [Francisella tularensis subsp. holarctica]|nr:amino acid transporter [Francisella tularensis subsp. holarctica]